MIIYVVDDNLLRLYTHITISHCNTCSAANGCRETMFTCVTKDPNGYLDCIMDNKTCDGVFDCKDSSDELGCGKESYQIHTNTFKHTHVLTDTQKTSTFTHTHANINTRTHKHTGYIYIYIYIYILAQSVECPRLSLSAMKFV